MSSVIRDWVARRVRWALNTFAFVDIRTMVLQSLHR